MADSPWPANWHSDLERYLQEAATLPAGLFHTDGDLLWANQGMRLLLGMDRGNSAPLDWLINPSFETLAYGSVREGVVFEGLLTAGDGQYISRSVHAKALRRGDELLIFGEFDALQLDRLNREMSQLNQEITTLQRDLIKEKQALERALKDLSVSEGKYRRLFEGAILGIFQSTDDGRLLKANPAFAETFGYDSPEELMQSVNSLADDLYADPDRFATNARLAIEQNSAVRVEERFRRRDGTPFLANLRKWAVQGERPEKVYLEGFVEDIEEQKRSEAALAQARKMESVAVLAGGIAHEFNNALAGLVGYIELLQLSFPEDTTAGGYCQSMQACSQRMTELARRLLAYAKGGKYQPRRLQMSTLVSESLEAAADRLAAGTEEGATAPIRWLHNISDQTRPVQADATQLKLVVGVLLENAAEALETVPDDRFIEVALTETRVTAETRLHESMPPGRYVDLTVADNGAGMPPEVLERVFEPFYTTKFQGRGMGMAAAYGIVKNHEGWIFVASTTGEGTTVRVLLPVAPSAGEA